MSLDAVAGPRKPPSSGVNMVSGHQGIESNETAAGRPLVVIANNIVNWVLKEITTREYRPCCLQISSCRAILEMISVGTIRRGGKGNFTISSKRLFCLTNS